MDESKQSTASSDTTDNKQLTAEELLKKYYYFSEGSFFDVEIKKSVITAIEEYSAQQINEMIKKMNTLQFEVVDYSDTQFKYLESQKQNDELIKQVEHLKENLELGVNTRMKYEELKVAGDKMAEALKRYTPEKAREVISEWEKLNK